MLNAGRVGASRQCLTLLIMRIVSLLACVVIVPSAICCCLVVCISCAQVRQHDAGAIWQKVELDLTQVDADGLRGPPDGKVDLAYEFCVPNTDQCKGQVAAIDPSVQFMPGSSGRVGAGKNDCLCIGSTHQKDYRQVLEKLARLPFVHRIIRCDFE